MSGVGVINKETVQIANQYRKNWQKQHPEAFLPATLTLYPSDPSWPAFQKSPLYKTVMWTCKGTGKTVASISIPGSPKGTMWCHLE
ncbi:uncharacterized protein LY79DRAFT_531490 [Colletotrichum navitas]|uniref:Uncharacterized protein n=1 Tax=Colletotrichum navitas TaxID=681940 RepID=A0AAD8PI60_9PEZI|nr:uncharacterized protein LY79DRAFT_531490 [Colletotrichum navitas]KAK1561405.1 hypothetical protein LY79DRAFT_531490 [Colletotrichum navitas]